jgi:hypothetical protein
MYFRAFISVPFALFIQIPYLLLPEQEFISANEKVRTILAISRPSVGLPQTRWES